jgi:FkbM family methyltransferase
MSEQSRIAGSTSHHPVFYKFPPWEGIVPEGFIENFLGVMQRSYYWQPHDDNPPQYPADRYVRTGYPPFDDQYFEWITVLESVVQATSHFTMVELGAGYGRWTANAWAALKQCSGLPHTLVAVEAEPTHFKWMAQHFADNVMDRKDLCLIEAAVTKADGTVGFHFGTEQWGGKRDWYGQSVGGSHLVKAMSLRTVLQPLTTVDLIHVDIQGVEHEVLEAADDELDAKVKRVHIGTHSRRNEDGLRSLFRRLGWESVRDFPGSSSVDTEFGEISFSDGVQTWLNPTFANRRKDEATILKQKLESSRREGARLWAELENLEEERLMRRSLGWRLIERGRKLRNWMAPSGSQRRRMYEFISKRV